MTVIKWKAYDKKTKKYLGILIQFVYSNEYANAIIIDDEGNLIAKRIKDITLNN